VSQGTTSGTRRLSTRPSNAAADKDRVAAAAKSQVKTSKTGSASPVKHATSDTKARDTKQVRKLAGENVNSKSAESPRRVRRSTTDLGVSATKSRRDSSAESTHVASPRRSEKPASRSSSQGARKPLQRSATDLMESTQQSDISQQSDEVSTIVI